MRALIVPRFGGPEVLRLEERPSPAPGPGQVRVAVRAIGVNYPDLLVIGGKYQKLPDRPFVPGKDAAGVVAGLGPDVEGLGAGDRVVVQLEHGAYAEEVVVDAEDVYRIPAGMSFVDAAAMGLVYQTAHFALLERGGFTPGEVVLVTGAGGGVGLATIQLTKALGGTALAATKSPSKADTIRRAGADAIIDLGMDDLREGLRDMVRKASGGRGADVVVDTAGGDIFDAAIRALAWRGRIVVVGFAAGRIPEIRVNYLLVKNISASGLQWSDYRDREPAWVRRVQDQLFRLYDEGKLRSEVMTYPMERAAEALELIRSGRITGKVVLTTGGGTSD